MISKPKLAILAAFAIILPLIVITSCSKKEQKQGAVSAAQQKIIYHCPMHQSYTSDKPGSCPICGMDLVPFEVTEATGAQKVEGLASINISPEKQKMLGVQTQLVSRKNISKTIRTVGRIAHDPELFYAEQEYITSLKTYEQAKNLPQGIALDNAKSMVDASKYKLSLMGFSEGQINDISKKDGPDNSLLLPAGDDKNIWVYASIYEGDLEYVKIGQNAVVTVPSNTSQKFNGKIVSIDPVMDPATRSVRARILAINPYGTIEHRTYLDVAIAVELGYKLIVPADAVLDTGIRQVVFIDKGEGTLEPKEVKLGMKNDNYYIVKSGINEGDKVVTNANFLIDSESQLKSVQ